MASPCHVSTPVVVHDAWVRWKHERSKGGGGGGGGRRDGREVRMRHVGG